VAAILPIAASYAIPYECKILEAYRLWIPWFLPVNRPG